MTGLESNVSAILSTSASTASVTSPANSSSNRLPWRTSVTPEKPSRGRAPSTALPWGSRISGLGMTSTTTRATGALLREGCECAASLVASRWRASGARALPPGERRALDGARGLRKQGGVAEPLPLVLLALRPIRHRDPLPVLDEHSREQSGRDGCVHRGLDGVAQLELGLVQAVVAGAARLVAACLQR